MLSSFRRLGALGACAAAAVTLGVCAPASASACASASASACASASANDGDEDVFTLYAKEIPDGDEGEDQGDRAPRVGDAFSFADDLYRAKGGEKAGRDGVTCTVVRLGNPGDLQCVGSFVLAGGSITAQALTPLDESEELPTFDIAITGGTGDYKAARGYIHATGDGDYQRLEFHVSH